MENVGYDYDDDYENSDPFANEIFDERMVDDTKYIYLPMDWDPNSDLLEPFNPDYLKDKTFNINSNIFNRGDGGDLRPNYVPMRFVEDLAGAKVNGKSGGYKGELYRSLKFDCDSKSIIYKKKEMFVRNPENNKLELTLIDSEELKDFKRLVGRVIIETDESRRLMRKKPEEVCYM